MCWRIEKLKTGKSVTAGDEWVDENTYSDVEFDVVLNPERTKGDSSDKCIIKPKKIGIHNNISKANY